VSSVALLALALTNAHRLVAALYCVCEIAPGLRRRLPPYASALRAASLLSRGTRSALTASLRGLLLLFTLLHERLASDPAQPNSPDAREASPHVLHAQWSAWVDTLRAESPEPSPPPHAADSSESESRFRRYAQAAPAAPPEASPDCAEREVERLVRISSPRGRAAWLRVLRLPVQGGSREAVVAAHRRLSALVHPDKCSHRDAGAAQQRLNDARSNLLKERGRAGGAE
jgi:hypothetical protein